MDRKRTLAARLVQYKVDRGCRTCGERHPAVLDIHHLTPLLDSDPHTRIYSLIWRNGWGWDRIQTHIEQECAVLCANCHRKIHWHDRDKRLSLEGSSPVSSTPAHAG